MKKLSHIFIYTKIIYMFIKLININSDKIWFLNIL